MKKLFWTLMCLLFITTSCYKDEIENLQSQIDQIKTGDISTINQQLKSIDGSIADLKATDKAVDGYITSLKTQTAQLEKTLDYADAKIDKVKLDLTKDINSARAEINTAKADVIAQLEAYKAEVAEQIKTMTASIAALESYKEELNLKITSLEKYDVQLKAEIDALKSESANSDAAIRTWVETTYATQAQYNSLSELVTAIQGQILTINQTLESLDTKITQTVTTEMEKAVAGLSDQIQADIQTGILAECNKSIASAKTELTQAYETAISTAITTLETSMKEWVSAQLSNYYTIAQTDAKLTSLKQEIGSQLTAQKTYLENLINGIKSDLSKQIAANSALISNAQNNISTLSDNVQANATKILSNSSAIAENATAISTNAANISVNGKAIDKIETDLAALDLKMTNEINAIKRDLTAKGASIDAINAAIAEIRNDYATKINNLKIALDEKIAQNKASIDANDKAIASNLAKINENTALIRSVESALQASIDANAAKIAQNVLDIAANTKAISDNASLIASNTTAITNNASAISKNAADIVTLRQDLIAAKTEITEAYNAAISTAITTLDGKITGQIATEVATINNTINEKIAAVNQRIDEIDARVSTCEKDIKSLKTAILTMQMDITDIQDQIAAILARVQSISYVPKYADGRATMYYTNNGKLTPGSATLDFELKPASTAAELAQVWQTALTVKAVYTLTRAASDFVDLTVESATGLDGILSVIVSGANLKPEFFTGHTSANVRLLISDGNNEIASDYINIVPWTTDVIYVPDANFKKYLLANFDENTDGEISETEAEKITAIDFTDTPDQIQSLAGIEYCSNLTSLNAGYKQITSLDLSNNTKLTDVAVPHNALTSLNISGCSALVNLDCSSNKLQELDVDGSPALQVLNCANNKIPVLNLTNNKELLNLNCGANELNALNLKNQAKLLELNCMSNHLTKLDLTKNVALTNLNCYRNQLVTLDLNKNISLNDLNCASNALTGLYIIDCKELTTLVCNSNQLSSLNLTQNVKLETLMCSKNKFETIDLTKNVALDMLDCSNNLLKNLDVSHNTLLSSLKTTGNTDLAKIWLDNAEHQSTMAITKDVTSNIFYNTSAGVYIPDVKFKEYLVANYDDDLDDEISIVEADNVTNINCANKGITDITGAEAFTNLVYFNCSGNSIKKIDCHTNTKLESLSCYGNPVEYLDLSNCAALHTLYMQNVNTNAVSGTTVTLTGYDQAATLKVSMANTPFETLSVTGSSVLTNLDFFNNDNIKTLNVYDNTVATEILLSPFMTTVNAYGNSVLQSINVKELTDLQNLDLHACNLQSLDVTKNYNLVNLDCSSNALTALDVNYNTALVSLKAASNQLTNIAVANNTALETLWLGNNKLMSINVRKNAALIDLRLSNNTDMTTVVVTNNPALETLCADGLCISDINLVNNTALKFVTLLDDLNLKSIFIDDANRFTLFRSCSSEGSIIYNEVGDKVTNFKGIDCNMIKVAGGTFTMGATPEQVGDANSNEKPAHQVTLSDYYIGQYEVTVGLWGAVMGYSLSEYKNLKNPVKNVSWDDIVNEFLPKLNDLTGKNFILPTEAQWEFAARGGNKSKGYKYSGSNNIDEVAWYCDNSNYETHPVGQKLPNELGLYDMSGNVYEWCSDWYGDYSAGAQTNPTGPASGSTRVLRGGSYYNHAMNCRVSYRYDSSPDSRYDYDCFRLALFL